MIHPVKGSSYYIYHYHIKITCSCFTLLQFNPKLHVLQVLESKAMEDSWFHMHDMKTIDEFNEFFTY